MSYKAWLSVGLKVLGVVTVINGLVQGIYQWGSLPSAQGMMPPWMIICSIAVPLVVLGAGLYLTLGTQGLVEKIYPDQEQKTDSAISIFIVAMKVLGAVLVVQALPDAVQIISNALYVYHANSVFNTAMQNQFIFERLLSTLLKFAIGYYLLVGGKWLQRLAFPLEPPSRSSDERVSD